MAFMGNKHNYTIGLDFDNTIISYDDLMYKIALEFGLIKKNINKNKRELRNYIRQLPNGEIEWQRIQSVAYGPRISEAELIDDVKKFFCLCKENKVDVYVISHKTQYSNLYNYGVNLRTAALNWMRENDLFGHGLGLAVDNVYFESTRSEKIQRIKSLECTHFIDDMEEVFIDEKFPENVKKILYGSNEDKTRLDMIIFKNWDEIINYFYGH